MLDRGPTGESVGCAVILAVAIGGIGACVHTQNKSENVTKLAPVESTLTQHPVEQVFRDHNGYRVMYTDADGLVRNVKYTENSIWNNYERTPCPDMPLPAPLIGPCTPEQNLKVYKDLPVGAPGFAASLAYRVSGWAVGDRWELARLAYTEIHLPKDASLAPGNETYGGKFPTHEMMHEIK